jgi:hypothetical protein
MDALIPAAGCGTRLGERTETFERLMQFEQATFGPDSVNQAAAEAALASATDLVA